MLAAGRSLRVATVTIGGRKVLVATSHLESPIPPHQWYSRVNAWHQAVCPASTAHVCQALGTAAGTAFQLARMHVPWNQLSCRLCLCCALHSLNVFAYFVAGCAEGSSHVVYQQGQGATELHVRCSVHVHVCLLPAPGCICVGAGAAAADAFLVGAAGEGTVRQHLICRWVMQLGMKTTCALKDLPGVLPFPGVPVHQLR